jgi:hypothetical protein
MGQDIDIVSFPGRGVSKAAMCRQSALDVGAYHTCISSKHAPGGRLNLASGAQQKVLRFVLTCTEDTVAKRGGVGRMSHDSARTL